MSDKRCYIISYDLRKERDYEKLYEVIKEYGTWARILKSTWAIFTSESADEIFNNLKDVLDDDDGLFVIQSGTESAWYNINCRNTWLKKFL